MTNPLTVGQRVRFTCVLDRYPHALIPEGATGTLVDIDDNSASIRMDDHYEGLGEWDNEAVLYDHDGAMLVEQDDGRAFGAREFVEHALHYFTEPA